MVKRRRRASPAPQTPCLPRPRRERPRGCGANERDELAPFQPDAVLALADGVVE
jgi:hypothetical protein